MVELTLSGVSRGPGKGPAPKVKPRPGRPRPGTAAQSAPAASDGTAARADPITALGDALASNAPAAPTAITAHVEACVAPSMSAAPGAASRPSGMQAVTQATPNPATQTATAVRTTSVILPTPPITQITPPAAVAAPTAVPSGPAGRPLGAPVALPRPLNIQTRPTPDPLPPAPPREPSISANPVVIPVISSTDLFEDDEHVSVNAAVPRIASIHSSRINPRIPAISSNATRISAPVSVRPPAVSATRPAGTPITPIIPTPRATAPPKIISVGSSMVTRSAGGAMRATAEGGAGQRRGDGSGPADEGAERDEEEEGEEEEVEQELNEFTIPYQSLGDLIRHKFKNGRLSKIEQLRLEQRKEAKERAKREGTPGSKASTAAREGSVAPSEAAPSEPDGDASLAAIRKATGPQIKLVNGKWVIDESSMVVMTAQVDEEDLETVQEDTNRHITSASFRTRARTGRVRWTADMTAMFYEGLSYFGTDFGMISLMFPALTRAQIKAKYNLEERLNSVRLSLALLKRRTAPEEITTKMRECVRERVAKRRATAEDDTEDVETALRNIKRAKKEQATNGETKNGGTPAAGSTIEGGDDADDEVGTARTPADAAAAIQLRRQRELEKERAEAEMGAPKAVDIAMPLPSRATTAGSSVGGGSTGIKPKVGPKAVPRRRKGEDAPAPAEPATAAQQQQLVSPAGLGDASTQQAAPEPAPPQPLVTAASRLPPRIRAIPVIGSSKKS